MALKSFSLALLAMAMTGIAVAQWQPPIRSQKTPAAGKQSQPRGAASKPKSVQGTAAPVEIELDGSYESSGSGGSVGIGLASSLRELQRLENVVGIGSPEYIREYMSFRQAYESEKKRGGGVAPKIEMPKPPSDDGLRKLAEQKKAEAAARQSADLKRQMEQRLDQEMVKHQKELEKEGFGNFTSGTKPLETKK